jgi:hypothetical protein
MDCCDGCDGDDDDDLRVRTLKLEQKSLRIEKMLLPLLLLPVVLGELKLLDQVHVNLPIVSIIGWEVEEVDDEKTTTTLEEEDHYCYWDWKFHYFRHYLVHHHHDC